MPGKFLQGIDLNNKRGINGADPTSPTDLTNKQYVDNLVSGLAYKNEVRAASTANVTTASPGTTLDGYTMVNGDRVLLKDQTTGSQNGIYIFNGSAAALTRATDADTTAELNNATVYVTNGTVNGGKEFTQTTKDPVVGTDALVWVQKTTGVTYTADGQGIELSGTTFSIELDGTTLTKSASGLRIGSGAAGAGLTEASGVLAVNPGTGIQVTGDQVIIDTGVVVRKYAADCAATTNPQSFTHGLGTKDLTVSVIENSSGALVWADPVVTNTTVTVDFGGAPTAAQYRVVAHG